MMIRRNYHTHTAYCDGKNTPEEIILEAIRQNMQAIGFSGHAHTPCDESYAMNEKAEKSYRGEISSLKEKYGDRIEIYCGIEQDFYSDTDVRPYDYVIGSVHYILKNGEYFPVDETAEILREAVERLYDGDIYALIKDYYETEANVFDKTNCDIIGHFDLITKFNEGEKMFSQSDPRYIEAYTKAAERLVMTGKIFEINSGAMSRGYRSHPYPSKEVLKTIKEMGGKIIFSSDSHEKATLLYAFDEMAHFASECGFDKAFALTKNGFEEMKF